jgi:hypothetical protein
MAQISEKRCIKFDGSDIAEGTFSIVVCNCRLDSVLRLFLCVKSVEFYEQAAMRV